MRPRTNRHDVATWRVCTLLVTTVLLLGSLIATSRVVNASQVDVCPTCEVTSRTSYCPCRSRAMRSWFVVVSTQAA